MKKSFFKNLFRDIKKTISSFLSIVIIIAIGVAFYAGVRATSPDMKMSADLYFSKNNLMDFKLISTLGLTKDDVEEISKIPGVTKAEGSYSLDAVIERDGRSQVLNINSLPQKDGINEITIEKGKVPVKKDEAVVEDRFLKSSKLKLGDTIVLKSGSEKSLTDKLGNCEFKIVGTAKSPMYISGQRQLSSVGNGSVRGFVYILPECFKSEAYTQVYIRTLSSESESSLLGNEEYVNAIKPIEKALKDIGTKRGEIRYAQIIKEGSESLNKAEEELQSARGEASSKFADAHIKLYSGRNKILKGFEELKRNEVLFNAGISAGEKRILGGKKQILASEAEIDSKLKDIEKRKLELSEGIRALNEAEKKLNAVDGQSAEEAKIVAQRNELLKNEKLLEDGEAQLNAGKKELEAKGKELYAFEIKLNAQRAAGIKKLSKGRIELKQAETELNKNAKSLKDEEEKANKKFEDAAAKIDGNRETLMDIKKPDWYVLNRGTNVGYETYRQDSDRINNIGKAFPLIFFLVAALVSLTTMARMVQDKRAEIGIFKALGYSNTAVVAHYLIYALSASIIGSLIGISIGFRLFPPLIMNAYSSLYSIPYRVAPFNKSIALQASLVAILFVAAASAFAALGELREDPASLMRPKPPKSGKRILLERANFIWKNLNFTWKVTARNIFRYKQRLFMTVIGIAACTALMITGFGIREGITGATKDQFNRIYKYDMQVSLAKNVLENEKNDIKQKAIKDINIKSILFAYSKNASVNIGGLKSQDVYVVVPEDKNAISNYINLTMKGENISLEDNGVILTEKLSRIVNKNVGDTIKITINDKTVEARISGITEHYIQHYIYISPAYYESLMGEKLSYNSFYGLLRDTSESSQENTSKTLKGIKNVNSVSFKNNISIDFDKSLNSVNSVVLVLIISAGVLAFVVIYNLTNINITERRRELATIKLLGFYNNELASYIYRENTILTIIGSVTGIFVGKILNHYILLSAETNVIMFLNKISPLYFLYSVVFTIFFSMVVNLVMYNRFEKIDMIESLKSVE